jgi:tRNA threonylcarbamoyladenosine biosynthesis protein TsaB
VRADLPVLALDSAGARASAAVAAAGELRAARHAARETAGFDLLGLVDAVLTAAGVRPEGLGGIVALRGPGSFTGVRVACATALGLARANGVPATGVSTLEALALAAPAGSGALLAVIDALRGEWFVQAFERGPLWSATPAGEPELVRPAAAALAGETLVVGNGAATFANAAAATGRVFEPLELASAVACAASLGRWAWDAAGLARPLYLRAPVAGPGARR